MSNSGVSNLSFCVSHLEVVPDIGFCVVVHVQRKLSVELHKSERSAQIRDQLYQLFIIMAPLQMGLRLLFLLVYHRVRVLLFCPSSERDPNIISFASTTPFTMRSYWRKYPNNQIPDLDQLVETESSGKCVKSRRLIILSLLLSGSLELNPGPDSTPCLCGQCRCEVQDNDASVACNYCNVWFHCRCIAMTDSHYKLLCNNSNISWICNCGFPNFSNGLFITFFSIDTTNSFTPLGSIGEDSQTSVSFDDVSSSMDKTPFSPDLTSTPKRSNTEKKKKKKPLHTKLRGMQIHYNGLNSVKSMIDFQATIAQHNPDIILGCESKLDDSIPTYSIFPDNYEVYRNDRNAFGGGVFVAVKMDFVSITRPEFDCTAEVSWASIDFTRNGTLYVGSFYRPPGAKGEVIDELQGSINNIFRKHRKMPALLLAGDFNLPDIDWENVITSHPRTHALHSHFLNFVNGCI